MVNGGEAERVGVVVFIFFIRLVVAGQPAGVGFKGNGRRGEKAVAVVRRILVRRENKIGVVFAP